MRTATAIRARPALRNTRKQLKFRMKRILSIRFLILISLIKISGCNSYEDIYNIPKYTNSRSSTVLSSSDGYYHDVPEYARLISLSYGVNDLAARKDWVDLPAPFDSICTFYSNNLAEHGYVMGISAQQWILPQNEPRLPPDPVAAYVRDVPADGGNVYRSVIVIVYDLPTPATRSWEPTDTYYLVIVSDGTLSAERARALPP